MDLGVAGSSPVGRPIFSSCEIAACRSEGQRSGPVSHSITKDPVCGGNSSCSRVVVKTSHLPVTQADVQEGPFQLEWPKNSGIVIRRVLNRKAGQLFGHSFQVTVPAIHELRSGQR